MSRPAWLLALAWVAGFTLIDSSIVSLALPAIAADFNRSVAEVAWVATGFLIALAASLIPAGRLQDRLGARRVMLGGAVGFMLTTAASGLAPTFELNTYELKSLTTLRNPSIAVFATCPICCVRGTALCSMTRGYFPPA